MPTPRRPDRDPPVRSGLSHVLAHRAPADLECAGWIDDSGRPLDPEGFKTPQQGTATQVWAATSPRLDGLGGVYPEDCDIAEPAPADGERTGVKDWATDPEQAARLWELSAELTGVDAFAHRGAG